MPENIEVEAKFKVNDLEKVTETLKAVGAKLNWIDTIEDYNFTLKQRDFWATVEGLRVRIKASRKGGTLTYKPSGNMAQDVLAVKEYETGVEDPEQLLKIFSYLDVVPLPGLPYVKKIRHDYTCGEFGIIIDEYPLVGNFIEIEKLVNSDSKVEEAKKRIEKFASELGLFEKDRQKVAVGFLLKEEYLKRGKH
ncbi:MAG: class IV adenylate cyclase [Methanothrix sp.]